MRIGGKARSQLFEECIVKGLAENEPAAVRILVGVYGSDLKKHRSDIHGAGAAYAGHETGHHAARRQVENEQTAGRPFKQTGGRLSDDVPWVFPLVNIIAAELFSDRRHHFVDVGLHLFPEDVSQHLFDDRNSQIVLDFKVYGDTVIGTVFDVPAAVDVVEVAFD